MLSDPERDSYRLLGLRRNLLGITHPRMLLHGVRAARAGQRQVAVAGDGMQLGGVFVVGAQGEVRYGYQSKEAGDHPAIAEVLAALA